MDVVFSDFVISPGQGRLQVESSDDHRHQCHCSGQCLQCLQCAGQEPGQRHLRTSVPAPVTEHSIYISIQTARTKQRSGQGFVRDLDQTSLIVDPYGYSMGGGGGGKIENQEI